MIARILKSSFARFGSRYGYDASYLHELVLASSFTRHRCGLPLAPYFAAKIVATRHADCGACLKLAIDMAVEAGVPLPDIRRLLVDSAGEAPPEMRLAARYARAVSEHDPALPRIIEECVGCWGKRGLAGLAAAVTGGQFFPCSSGGWDGAAPVRRCWRGCGRPRPCHRGTARPQSPPGSNPPTDAAAYPACRLRL